MSNLRSSVLFVSLAAAGVLAGACTLLLTKEPLTCATDRDCEKFPGTVCIQSSLECHPGGASNTDGSIPSTSSDGGADGGEVTDSPPGTDSASDPCLSAT